MRPVRVTTPGAGLSLPLRMVAVGHRTHRGPLALDRGRRTLHAAEHADLHHLRLRVWCGTGRPQESNYTTVRQQKEAAMNYARLADRERVAALALPDRVAHPERRGQPGLPADRGRRRCRGGRRRERRRRDGGPGAAGRPRDPLPGWGCSPRCSSRASAPIWRTLRSANDLVVEASADQSVLSNQLPRHQVDQRARRVRRCPTRAPLAYGSSGSSSGSVFGDDGLGGSNGSSSGSGCSTTPDDGGGANGGVILAGLAVAAIALHRGRRRAS